MCLPNCAHVFWYFGRSVLLVSWPLGGRLDHKHVMNEANLTDTELERSLPRFGNKRMDGMWWREEGAERGAGLVWRDVTGSQQWQRGRSSTIHRCNSLIDCGMGIHDLRLLVLAYRCDFGYIRLFGPAA